MVFVGLVVFMMVVELAGILESLWYENCEVTVV